MEIELVTCPRCKKERDIREFYITNSMFFPTRRANVCKHCINKQIFIENGDLQFVDKVCQWLDYAFLPNEWIKIYDVNQQDGFDMYSSIYSDVPYNNVHWAEINEKWKELEKDGILDSKIAIINEKRQKELSAFWGDNYLPEELEQLQQLFEGLSRTQNINGDLQVDQAKKLCKVSLLIDQKIRDNVDFKNMLESYNKLVTIADFTPKNIKNANDFDSTGEVFAYLEKTGFKNKFFDGVTRDIVDKTMKDIQASARKLYIGETGIAEDIQSRIESLQKAQALEENYNATLEEEKNQELDDFDAEAFDIDNDFKIEVD